MRLSIVIPSTLAAVAFSIFVPKIVLAFILFGDVTEPAKIRIRRMPISCAKPVGCGFVAQSEVPAVIATAIQLSLSYLKLNSYKQTSGE